jgi:hypothetical protein
MGSRRQASMYTGLFTALAGLFFFSAGRMPAADPEDAALKADLKRAQTMAKAGLSDGSDFHELLKKVSPHFQTVPVAEGSSTNRFFKMELNRQGAGFDGLRFKVSPGQDRKFIWIFASDKKNPVLNWMIADSHGPIEGTHQVEFSEGRDPDEIYFGHAFDLCVPWGREANRYVTVTHTVDATLKAGEEYWLWLRFKDGSATVFQGAITLPPAGTQMYTPQEQQYALDLFED